MQLFCVIRASLTYHTSCILFQRPWYTVQYEVDGATNDTQLKFFQDAKATLLKPTSPNWVISEKDWTSALDSNCSQVKGRRRKRA